jgi:hypothetical protein
VSFSTGYLAGRSSIGDNEHFEAFMRVCFGAAWPFSIYKSYKSRINKGKSLGFLIVVIIGYKYIYSIAYKYFITMAM